MKITNPGFVCFLLCAFLIGSVLQITSASCASEGSQITALWLSLAMFAPAIATFITLLMPGQSLSQIKDMGWAVSLRGNWKYLIFALWGPAVIAILGGSIYVCVFPEAFGGVEKSLLNTSSEYELVRSMLKMQGITIEKYMIIATVQAVTIAPFLNMFFALGEEIGWRGTMYPYLKERLGVNKGRVVGGIIWAVWHYPIILMAGHNYGMEYIGAPFAGPLVFCLSCILMGTILDYIYEKTKMIWLPALMHGATNAFTLTHFIQTEEALQYSIFGPLFTGLLGMIPLLIIAVFIYKKKTN